MPIPSIMVEGARNTLKGNTELSARDMRKNEE
jgi:hypothetical protein